MLSYTSLHSPENRKSWSLITNSPHNPPRYSPHNALRAGSDRFQVLVSLQNRKLGVAHLDGVEGVTRAHVALHQVRKRFGVVWWLFVVCSSGSLSLSLGSGCSPSGTDCLYPLGVLSLLLVIPVIVWNGGRTKRGGCLVDGELTLGGGSSINDRWQFLWQNQCLQQRRFCVYPRRLSPGVIDIWIKLFFRQEQFVLGRSFIEYSIKEPAIYSFTLVPFVQTESIRRRKLQRKLATIQKLKHQKTHVCVFTKKGMTECFLRRAGIQFHSRYSFVSQRNSFEEALFEVLMRCLDKFL